MYNKVSKFDRGKIWLPYFYHLAVPVVVKQGHG